MRRFASIALLVSPLFLGACAVTPDSTTAKPDPFVEFQRKEARLYAIGHKLATSNASECAKTEPSVGVLLHDAQAYKYADRVKQALGLTGDFGVQAVAAGSPAAQAGILRNDTLLEVDGVAVDSLPDRRDWQRLADLRQLMAASLEDGQVDLVWRTASGDVRRASVASTAICESAFELVSGKADARADGRRVLIGENFAGLDYAEDEFAAVLAHEMAHNLLGHLGKRSGWSIRQIRMSEREADRLAPWLLANAGYDPSAVVRMLQRWGPRHGGGILRKPTHDGWDERVEYLELELKKIDAATRASRDGRANWQIAFSREPELIQQR